MAQSEKVPQFQQDYWRPVLAHDRAESSAANRNLQSDVACSRCGTEFVIGSRFCHVCGEERGAVSSMSSFRWLEAVDFDNIRHGLGLSVGSLIASIFGAAFAIAALAVGFFYSTTTLTDWQAVQTWRIEWMLAAIMAFAAGILLKKPE
ncbi:MAG TPA: hypothetical protein VMU28_01600 [Terriglobales bacterium]|nr:hypothetical protein [Terriglobales bacterium]